ncbi:hypothetical protein JOF48_003819 [Arthrobacter stackebrandtii]|uniref:Uncharacterized protein n=1 Tax=Arthrobacter stackebrandtii TaxID=272161 RepID=A0ABS4Z2J4_9MICC|nr:DUF488 family protein [Arthrobacter stackebrandtii]MBP2415020.1 hypothetical protein [Arthrobacter stackebrandtii]
MPSSNGAWWNKSFRDYADDMQTPDFAVAVEELVETAATQVTAIMCAGPARPHTLTRFARTEGNRVWYPPEDGPAAG